MHVYTVYFSLFVLSVPGNVKSSSSVAQYGKSDGYGTEWMYFPDGDDVPRRISLEMPPLDFLRQAFWIDALEFRLYTRYNRHNYVLLDESANPVNNSGAQILELLRTKPIKIVTHGWESSADKNAVINIMQAYLEHQDVVVIGVDWSSVADSIMYPVVAMQTSKVGEAVGKFLDALSDRYNVQGSQVHLIGHSLGAHVMGNAGSATKLRPYQITGLDPARPLFEFPPVPNDLKLDITDAEFVDVIHTCSGILGVLQPIGHADFFPNEGLAPQPGCGEFERIIEACSHSRSHILFAESIESPRNFPAYRCNNWASFSTGQCPYSNTYLGPNVNRSAFGTFYLTTNKNSPYGRGLDVR